MALDSTLLTQLMLTTSTLAGAMASVEFSCYAAGVVQGLKLGTATIQTTGVAGTPGTGKFIGAIQPGAIGMSLLVQQALLGIIPPPTGSITPLQPIYYLAISQIATHVLTSLQVDAPASDSVATGVGIIVPGGFNVSGTVIGGFIVQQYVSKGLTPTPLRISIANAIGIATQQMMSLATMPAIPIIGGVPATPSAPSAGVRIGVIS